MGENSHIEWTDHTFNPWIGCTKISPGCNHCYAERLDHRMQYTQKGWGKGNPRHRTSTWRDPLKWNRAALEEGVRRKIFCASLADILDDEAPTEWRNDLWKLIAECNQLTWQLLTKRPQNYLRYLPFRWAEDGVPSNVWCGTTVEDQKRADDRIPHLIKIQSDIHFLSIEPMLEKIDIRKWLNQIEWVIVGGESGPQARPINIEWVLDIKTQCKESGTAFFFKQWGGFHKSEAGRMLHGRTYDAFPNFKKSRINDG